MKNIKLKVIAAVIASSTIFGVTIPVNATPVSGDLEQNVQVQQEEYKEIENKINTLHMEISVILDEITDILVKIEDNDAKISEVEAKKAETEEQIRETEANLHIKIEEYGEAG